MDAFHAAGPYSLLGQAPLPIAAGSTKINLTMITLTMRILDAPGRTF